MRNNLTFTALAQDWNGTIVTDAEIDKWADDMVTLWKAGTIDTEHPRQLMSGDTLLVAEVDETGILTIYDTKIDRVLRVRRKTEGPCTY